MLYNGVLHTTCYASNQFIKLPLNVVVSLGVVIVKLFVLQSESKIKKREVRVPMTSGIAGYVATTGCVDS